METLRFAVIIDDTYYYREIKTNSSMSYAIKRAAHPFLRLREEASYETKIDFVPECVKLVATDKDGKVLLTVVALTE